MVRLEPMVIQKLCVMNMSQCNNELISVVMGVFYQKEDLYLLETSIKSIINQTYRNFEFLICENGSSYDAKQILKKYSKIDKRIKLIDGVGANSLSEKLNRCIKVSKGKYIARQDDDDYSKPDRFKAQLEYLKNNQDISFVGCSVEIKQDRKVLGVRYFPENPADSLGDWSPCNPWQRKGTRRHFLCGFHPARRVQRLYQAWPRSRTA